MSASTQRLQMLDNIRGSIAETEDALANLTSITPEKEDKRQAAPEVDEDGNPVEAKFGIAEAIATTAIASFVLGPFAIPMGIAQGLMVKKERQGVLDTLAKEEADRKGVQAAVADTYSAFDDEMATLLESSETDDERAQLGPIASKIEAAKQAILIDDPGAQSDAANLFRSAGNDIVALTNSRKAAGIAADAEEARLAIELGDKKHGRYRELRKDYDSQTDPFLNIARIVNVGLDALQNGSPVQIHTAIVSGAKAIDPESVVRESESRAYREFGDLLTQAAAKLENLFGSGATLTAQQKREMGEMFMTIYNQAASFQERIDADFGEQAVEAELLPRHLDNFEKLSKIDPPMTLEIPEDDYDISKRQITEFTDKVKATGSSIQEYAQGVLDRVQKFGGTADDAIAQVVEDMKATAGSVPAGVARPHN